MRARPLLISLVLSLACLACTPRGAEPPPAGATKDQAPPPAITPTPTPSPGPPQLGLSMIAPGVHHTCALEGGRVLCWGLDRFGMLGVGPLDHDTRDGVSTPHPVVGLDEVGPIVQVATDYDTSCALTQAGAVYCWGANDHGQLGVGDTVRRDRPTLLADVHATTLVIAYQHACALGQQAAWCWGQGFELGPTRIPSLIGIDQLASPGSHTCTLTRGVMSCWGDNSSGQIGNGEGGCEYDEPLCSDCKRLPDQTCKRADQPSAPLDLPNNLRAIAASNSYTYAIDEHGGVWQWGQVGQTMSFAAKPNYRPQPVTELPPIVELSAGASHVCARSEDGQLHCWGNNAFGQLGFESARNDSEQPLPRRVQTLPPVRAIAAGFYLTCALTGEGADTQAYCWGDNGNGQLGDGTTERRHTPTLVRMPSA